ncbi:hypothetical protein [Paenibacillus sp. SI8]|uniref:hypothetical protein n=1 Tax=unclassified Paenibacillus TaxID=185978 RepID=UPI003466A453
MRKLISARLSAQLLIIANVLLLLLHILILLRIVPYEFIWGGQIKDSSSLIIFEITAICLTMAFIFIVSLKIGYLFAGKFKRTAAIGIWIMFGYLVLNTIGNLASTVTAETFIFTPITVGMALLAFRLATEKPIGLNPYI